MSYRAGFLSLFLLLPLGAAENTQAVLGRMDQEAAGFRQMSCKLVKATHTAVLNDTSTESGKMWLRRTPKGIQLRTEISDPDPRSYSFEGNAGQVYYPKINTVQIWDVGKSRALVDQFLLLGFGSSGKELSKNYTVKATGEDSLGGRKATRLELVPKSKKVLEQIQKVELWIPSDAGYPLQQKFHQPGGDYYLVSYSDIQVNPNLPEDAFRLKLPADVKREYPQK